MCHKSVDLAFILDASGTIDDSQWKLTKDFVQGVSNGFRLASNGTRISIVTYATLPHIERRFDDLNRNDNLIGFLEAMSQPRGDTRTDRALKAVRDQLIISEAGARDFTPKAIVIVTDGGDKHDTFQFLTCAPLHTKPYLFLSSLMCSNDFDDWHCLVRSLVVLACN